MSCTRTTQLSPSHMRAAKPEEVCVCERTYALTITGLLESGAPEQRTQKTTRRTLKGQKTNPGLLQETHQVLQKPLPSVSSSGEGGSDLQHRHIGSGPTGHSCSFHTNAHN